MNEWMNEWMDELVSEWTDGRTNERTDGRILSLDGRAKAMLKQMLVCSYPTNSCNSRPIQKGLFHFPKQLLLRSNSAPNNIKNANLYEISGFKSS